MFSGDRGQCLLSSLPWSSWSSVIATCHSDLAAVIIPCNSEHVAWQDLTLQTMMMGWSWIASIFTDFGNSSTVCRGCSVTSRCPPDYSVTDKTAPHKFLFWPRVQVNHPPGQGARVTCWPSLVILFSFPTFLVMALFRVQGWHRLDGCPVLHLMVSLDFPYFLEVLGILSKLCWLNLIFDESLLSTLAIDQNRQSFSPRQQYSVTLCFY